MIKLTKAYGIFSNCSTLSRLKPFLIDKSFFFFFKNELLTKEFCIRGRGLSAAI